MVSIHVRVVSLSPDSREPSQSEKKAPLSNGRLPSADCAPRYQKSVTTTRKIMKRISQAPLVCDPKNRESRPSLAGLFVGTQDREDRDAHEDQDARRGPRGSRRSATCRRSGWGSRHEQGAVGLEDGQAEDEEAPEGEHVREARHGPLEQFALAQHLGRLGFDALRSVGRAADRRLAGAPERYEEPDPLAGEGEDDDRDGDADDGAQKHVRVHESRLSRRTSSGRDTVQAGSVPLGGPS